MDAMMGRREVLGVGGLALAATAMATPARVKEAKPIRGKDLLRRGEPEVAQADALKFIGMPVGGLFAGTVYLGGDGQLWNWDIFNQERLGCVERPANAIFMGDSLNAMGGANYVDPVRQQSPFNQKFELRVIRDGAERAVRFGDVRFRGEYPVGKVSFAQSDADVEMSLTAFSPFCPLEVEDSSFPAVTMTFLVQNVGKARASFRLAYGADNPSAIYSRKLRDDIEPTIEKTPEGGLVFSSKPRIQSAPKRPKRVFEDWSSGTYGQWVASGTAFGDRPQRVKDLPAYMGSVDAGTEFVVNTHQTRNGEDVVAGDVHTGTLRSPSFTIDRAYIQLRVGGGNHPGGTCVNLVIDGKTVRTCTGRSSNQMAWQSFSVREFEGKTAHLELVDRVSGGWGQISLGEVIFTDEPQTSEPLEQVPDYGTFCVESLSGTLISTINGNRGEVSEAFDLNPGESKEVSLVIAWHFPNCARNLPGKRHWYAKRWKDAREVAQDLKTRWSDLRAKTLAWNETWYDSTLPYWFLDRTFVNTSILATTTCFRLDEGRFYFWEGVGCCPGTCTHVWGYAQAIGRVFPEIERGLRKDIDFGIAYRQDTGAIDYRAEYHQTVAHDGQASCILRAYREHQMSTDEGFLRSIWPKVKGAMEHLMRQDVGQDGILDGAQYNTLDTAWFGEIAWISSLYVAALRASEAMANEMGDPEFANRCKTVAQSGSARISKDLFNGEYFVNKVDEKRPEANNTNVGCHIDQVYGQAWACQVGLPRVVPADKAKSALKALYKYSFYEDVWEYRRANRAIPGGRWYATPKEAGLIMCSFPKGGAAESIGKSGDAWAVGYFNECMSGFEYQVAAHMIAEGLVEQGMTLVRAIHDRYQPSKRNPYNEVECSDHYGRAMASYGAFVSICGFHVHGPRKKMSFSPKVKGRFRAPFISPEGWGVYERSASGVETTTYRFRNSALVRS